MKLNEIKPNPGNPRTIKDERFKKLCRSIEEFPKMMELRPIVVDNSGMILGGNMRYRALKELGHKEIPDEWVKRADELTEDEKRRFIIEDNVPFGDWDFDMLANEWDENDLSEWALDVPRWADGHEVNGMNEDDLDLLEKFDPMGESKGFQRVVFIFDGPTEAESYLNNLGVRFIKRNIAWQVNLNTPFTS